MPNAIHVVSDNDADRASMEAGLAAQPDVTVRSFQSGNAFIAEIDDLEAGIVLLDLSKRGAKATDALGAMGETPHLSAICLVNSGDISAATQAFKYGAIDVLERPKSAEDILDSISRLETDDGSTGRSVAEEQIAKLSPRQKQALVGLLEGRSNNAIGAELSVSPRTVEIYRANILALLEVQSLLQAARIAFAAGLITREERDSG